MRSVGKEGTKPKRRSRERQDKEHAYFVLCLVDEEKEVIEEFGGNLPVRHHR
ncbi:MAG: hypothetical protein GX027_09480 [Clostridiaceae bacterium]|jgi:hypothetical protein|nr:hypothetical protein [Clostridiaceae bacterium]